MKKLPALIVVVAALAAGGCISTSDFEAVQRQVAELQEELSNVRRTTAGKEDVQNVSARVVEQTETLLRSNATLVAKVDEIEERIQSNLGTVEQTNHRLDRISQQIAQAQRDVEDLKARVAALQAAPPAAATGTASSSELTVPAPAPAPGIDPTQTYQAAFRDYQRGNFDLAIEGFREYLEGSPDSEMADNAAYWIGESMFSQKKY